MSTYKYSLRKNYGTQHTEKMKYYFDLYDKNIWQILKNLEKVLTYTTLLLPIYVLYHTTTVFIGRKEYEMNLFIPSLINVY